MEAVEAELAVNVGTPAGVGNPGSPDGFGKVA